MLKANQLFVFLLQLNLYGFCEPNRSFLSVPKSAIVKIRANVSLECVVFNSTNQVFWDFYNVSHNNDETKIYNHAGFIGQMKSRYRINNETRGQFNLEIDPADHGHAGRYICKDFFFSSQAIAEINVIDSDPVCGMNVTNMAKDQTISLWCEINSTGFLIPQMKWTKGNGELINSTTQSTVINGSTKTTTSSVRLQIQPQDNNAMERITVKCTTSFMWKNGSTERVPHYEHVWNHNLPLATEKDATSETVSVSYTQKAFATADPSPPQLEAWIIPVVGCSIVSMILIILCIVFQYRKKKGSCNNSSTQSKNNPDVLHKDSLPPDGSKSSNAREGANPPVQDGAAIYAEVKKKTKKKEPKNHTETKTSSNTAQTKGQACIVGEDGTVYMDFSGAKQTEAKKVQSKPSQFSRVEEYVCVDHTFFAPPHAPNSANAPSGKMNKK